MKPDPAARQPTPTASVGRRLHAALMPDYNTKATAYWWTMVLGGSAVLVVAATRLAAAPLSTLLQVVAGTLFAMLAGVFPVRIPNSKNSFAAGEIFIFLLLLLHGPEAATLAAAAETAVGAIRTSKRWTSRIASPAISAVSMFAAGSLLYAVLAGLRTMGLLNDALLVAAVLGFSAVYFMLNAVFATSLPRLKRNEPLRWSHLLGLMSWVSLGFIGSAAVSALLFLAYRQSGLGVLLAIVPLLAAVLAAFHYYNRQQEAQAVALEATTRAAEREARAIAAAAQREAELAARHLKELQASERRFHSAFTHASIGMALLGFDGQVLQANASLRTLLGVDEESIRARRFGEFVVDADRAALSEQLARIDQGNFEAFELELRCLHRSGETVWVTLHCSFFSEPGSATPCLILQVQDITSRRRAEDGLQQLAFSDTLTGLPNRRRFHDHLAHAVTRARADPSQRFAVLFLDFDRFKVINDSLGHGAGDEFLVRVSQRVQERLRQHDVVARLGGDEFAILMQRFHEDEAPILLAERLLQALKEPFMVADTEVITSASIGITTSAVGYADPQTVLRDADIAMYRAKATGKARYVLFDAELHSDASRRLRLESDLRQAIQKGHLSAVYQPVYELESGRLTGFEALARWAHPERGEIGPDAFIPIAEDSGLMVPITDIMLRLACHQLKEWQVQHPRFAELTVQVNLSSKDLAHGSVSERVTHAIAEAGVSPRHLTLELTENILMERLETALPQLNRLRDLGVRLCVDDFGTGYSSLSHLSRLPIDGLKVDRSFVRNLSVDSKDAMVVLGIVHLGQSLGKVVVAEGIETVPQFDQLRGMGCHSGQGFLMSRPLSVQAVGALLQQLQDGQSHALAGAALSKGTVLH